MENSFTSRDISVIVKACSRSCVKKIKIGDLEIEFNGYIIDNTPFAYEADTKPNSQLVENQTHMDFSEEVNDQLEDDLLISDPSAWEAQQLGERSDNDRVRYIKAK